MLQWQMWVTLTRSHLLEKRSVLARSGIIIIPGRCFRNICPSGMRYAVDYIKRRKHEKKMCMHPVLAVIGVFCNRAAVSVQRDSKIIFQNS